MGIDFLTRCAGITCYLNNNGRRAKRPRTLALASLLSSVSSLQDSRNFSSPRKDLVLGEQPRTLALASLLSSVSSLQDSRDFSSPRKDFVLGRDRGIGSHNTHNLCFPLPCDSWLLFNCRRFHLEVK